MAVFSPDLETVAAQRCEVRVAVESSDERVEFNKQ